MANFIKVKSIVKNINTYPNFKNEHAYIYSQVRGTLSAALSLFNIPFRFDQNKGVAVFKDSIQDRYGDDVPSLEPNQTEKCADPSANMRICPPFVSLVPL